MPNKGEVWIFYSSEAEPELPAVYSQGIAYLHESNFKTHVIDVLKHPEFAEKLKIMATPAIIIKKGSQTHKFIGIVDGLRKLLDATLHGKSILHLLGFKEGRELGSKIKTPKEKAKIEGALMTLLNPRGIDNFKLVRFELKEKYVKLTLTSDFVKGQKSNKAQCNGISALLGGIFTEIFDAGTHFKELSCMAQGNKRCLFETIKGKEGQQRFEDGIEKMSKKKKKATT